MSKLYEALEALLADALGLCALCVAGWVGLWQ